MIALDIAAAARIAERLVTRRETVGISESSSGGLISATLLSLPGASAYFLGAAVICTGQAREVLLGITPEQFEGPSQRDRSSRHTPGRGRAREVGRDLGAGGNRRGRACGKSVR